MGSERFDHFPYRTTDGQSFPLGATVLKDGTNFSVFSKHAEGIELLLFDSVADGSPAEVVRFDPARNSTGQYWHVCVENVQAGQLYGFRADGPFDPSRGLRFDREKLLLDPYGRSVAVPKAYSRAAAILAGDNAQYAMKSVVTDVSSYDWEGDRPLCRPLSETVIYETHLRGFTRHPSSGVSVERQGTYSGVIEKIEYLRDLGVTAVEFMPLFQFDPQDAAPGLSNYWGYSPVSLFSPHLEYSLRGDPLACLDEFRDMVKALHRAGIEVIMDVVYNHTAEGGADGPTLSFKGLENGSYYILDQASGSYEDYTGCGNTLNADHPVVRRMICDSVRYWVEEMHVDGFRFDLASILSRDEDGQPMKNPPILWDLDSDPSLAGTKLIAEAWDAAGLYQLGNFIGDNWTEWNGKFRDDVRRYLRGDSGLVSNFATRMLGSPDLYGANGKKPTRSINFVTCHDGFTLNDLVSYSTKHNENNRQENQDGSNENYSANYGIEGPSDDPGIERIRLRQIKNALAITLCSIGVPMILMGDEARRSQAGNNNAFCQDNELSWLNWELVERHSDLHRFTKLLIQRRLSPVTSGYRQASSLAEFLGRAKVEWHGTKLGQPDWGFDSHTLSFTVQEPARNRIDQVISNAYWEPLEFEIALLPDPQRNKWKRIIDTSLDSPHDIWPADQAPELSGQTYVVQPRSIVLLSWVSQQS